MTAAAQVSAFQLNTMKRIYISLPISGYDYRSRQRFAAKVAAVIATEGHIPVNPMWSSLNSIYEDKLKQAAECEGIVPTVDYLPNHAEFMREDISELLNCDCICLCEGWEKSKGCVVEAMVARSLDLDIVFYDGKGFRPVSFNIPDVEEEK